MYLTSENLDHQYGFYFKDKRSLERWNPNRDDEDSSATKMDQNLSNIIMRIAETRKILTSRNFCFISLTNDKPLPEPIAIIPDAPGEGESEGSTQPQSGNKSDSLKRKRTEKEDLNNQRCTRGIHIDY